MEWKKVKGLSFFMGDGGDEEEVLGYEKFYPFFVGVRKTLPLFCWGTKNFITLLGYEKFLLRRWGMKNISALLGYENCFDHLLIKNIHS